MESKTIGELMIDQYNLNPQGVPVTKEILYWLDRFEPIEDEI